jgi:hypothetical protein
MGSSDDEDDEDEYEQYPPSHRHGSNACCDDDEDSPHPVQRGGGRPLPKRKQEPEDDDDEDDDEEDELGAAPLEKSGRPHKAAKVSDDDANAEEQSAEEDGQPKFLFWCKNAGRVYEVPDSCLVREMPRFNKARSREALGQFMHSKGEATWKNLQFHGDTVTVLSTRAGNQQSTERAFTWCLRFQVTGDSEGDNRKNARFLVPVPANYALKAVERWMAGTDFRGSSLVQRFHPGNDKKKQLSPSSLKWVSRGALLAPFSTALLPESSKGRRSGGKAAPETPPVRNGAPSRDDHDDDDDDDDDDARPCAYDLPPPKKPKDDKPHREEKRARTKERPIEYSMASREGHAHLFGSKGRAPAPAPEAAPAPAPAAEAAPSGGPPPNGAKEKLSMRELPHKRRQTTVSEFAVDKVAVPFEFSLDPPAWAKSAVVQVTWSASQTSNA